MDFLSAPSDFLVQCFQKFDSKDLGVEDLGKEFSRNHMRLCMNISNEHYIAFEDQLTSINIDDIHQQTYTAIQGSLSPVSLA